MPTTLRPRPAAAAGAPPALIVGLVLVALAGCQQQPPGRFDEVQKETPRNAPAVSAEAVAGSAFNTTFPKPDAGFNVVFTQEKTGFAQAKLVKEGQDVATLAVSDTRNNPEALDKFKDADGRLEGYPVVDVGEMGTAMLVADRYQVQVRSIDANFDKFQREDWLKKFDLANLAKIQ